MITIYGLYDPRNGELKYIGQTTSAAVRKQQHLKNIYQGNLQLYRWKYELEKLDLCPLFKVIGEYSNFSEADDAEKQAIDTARGQGLQILNIAGGGLGVRPKKVDKLTLEDWTELGLRYRLLMRALSELHSYQSDYSAKSSHKLKLLKNAIRTLREWKNETHEEAASIFGDWALADNLFLGELDLDKIEDSFD